MTKNEIIERLKPKCNGCDLPMSLDLKYIAHLLTDLLEEENDVTKKEESISDKDLEVKTERNAKIISSFIEHCKKNGIGIPDIIFESYFGA